MEKDPTETSENSSTSFPKKSFSVAFELMAKLLRSEVKMKDRSMKVLSTHSLPTSFSNSFKQIAKLFRTAIHNIHK
jgi:hypothetical protein